MLEQETADNRAERDGGTAGRPPQPNGEGSFLAVGEHVGEQGQRGGEGHGCSHPHDRPRGDQLARARTEATDEARDAKDAKASHQHALAAKAVGDAARGEKQRCEDEVVGVDHPLQLGVRGAELTGQRRQDVVDKCRVQVDNEGRHQ